MPANSSSVAAMHDEIEYIALLNTYNNISTATAGNNQLTALTTLHRTLASTPFTHLYSEVRAQIDKTFQASFLKHPSKSQLELLLRSSDFPTTISSGSNNQTTKLHSLLSTLSSNSNPFKTLVEFESRHLSTLSLPQNSPPFLLLSFPASVSACLRQQVRRSRSQFPVLSRIN